MAEPVKDMPDTTEIDKTIDFIPEEETVVTEGRITKHWHEL